MKKNAIKKKVFEGKCYNFALGFVNGWLLERGSWNPEEAIKMSSTLSKEIEKTVKDFPRTVHVEAHVSELR